MRLVYFGLVLASILGGIYIGYNNGNIILLRYVGLVILIHGSLKIVSKYYKKITENKIYKNFKETVAPNSVFINYFNKHILVGLLIYLYSINITRYTKYSLFSYIKIGIIIIVSFLIFNVFQKWVIQNSKSHRAYSIKISIGLSIWILLLITIGFVIRYGYI